jgi:hypothetical protein
MQWWCRKEGSNWLRWICWHDLSTVSMSMFSMLYDSFWLYDTCFVLSYPDVWTLTRCTQRRRTDMWTPVDDVINCFRLHNVYHWSFSTEEFGSQQQPSVVGWCLISLNARHKTIARSPSRSVRTNGSRRLKPRTKAYRDLFPPTGLIRKDLYRSLTSFYNRRIQSASTSTDFTWSTFDTGRSWMCVLDVNEFICSTAHFDRLVKRERRLDQIAINSFLGNITVCVYQNFASCKPDNER